MPTPAQNEAKIQFPAGGLGWYLTCHAPGAAQLVSKKIHECSTPVHLIEPPVGKFANRRITETKPGFSFCRWENAGPVFNFRLGVPLIKVKILAIHLDFAALEIRGLGTQRLFRREQFAAPVRIHNQPVTV